MSLGSVAGATAQQPGLIVQSPRDLLGRQNLDARRRQFDGQRQAFQPDTDRRHGLDILGAERELRLDEPAPVHKQRHRRIPGH